MKSKKKNAHYKEDILQRWNKYMGTIFHDNNGTKSAINKIIQGHIVLKYGVRSALLKINGDKEAGPVKKVKSLSQKRKTIFHQL